MTGPRCVTDSVDSTPMLPDAAAFTAADVLSEATRADSRIRAFVRETPLEHSPALSRETGARVYLKLECAQVTGSFKVRGAFNRLLALDDPTRARGIVTASTGNHALATAHALAELGIDGEIFLPSTASPAKVDALRLRGARIEFVDGDPIGAELRARARADETGRPYVSPYNDRQVIGGQGTVALELLRQAERIDAVFTPVGGGGLIAGVAGTLRMLAPHVRHIGCQPSASTVMASSVRAGHLIELPSGPSISDATLGLVEPGAITFPICQTCVDEWVLIGEDELRSAVQLVLVQHSLLIEGAAALGVAALRRARRTYAGQVVVLILSGSHLSVPALREILDGAPIATPRDRH